MITNGTLLLLYMQRPTGISTGYLFGRWAMIRQSDKYPVFTWAGYLSGRRLGGLSRYVRALNGARWYRLRPCLCEVLVVSPQRHDGSRATDDLNPIK